MDNDLIVRDDYINSLSRSLISISSLANVPGLLRKIITGKMWQERIVHQTGETVRFLSFREFVEAYPPEGLKTSISLLIRICDDYKDMEAVSLIAIEVGGKPGGNNNPYGMMGKPDDNRINLSITKVDSIVDKPTYGNTTDYKVRRLAKKRPDIHEKVLAGELSVDAGAIEAGFRRPKFQMPKDPVAAGQYLAKRVDAEWMATMLEAYSKNISQ